MTERSDFNNTPHILTAIEAGIQRKLHTGVQIYVSLNGEVVVNSGFGTATSQTAYNARTISLWRSAGKPVTTAAILQQVEKSNLQLDSQLGDVLPETRSTAFHSITIQQLLTHTSGLPIIETGWPQDDWDAVLTRIMASEPNGNLAAYQPQSTWFLLGRILERITSLPFGKALEETITGPLKLNMHDAWCGVPKKAVQRYREESRLPDFYTREKGQLAPSPFGAEPWLTNPSPGGNMRGPVSELGKFYEMLMRGGSNENGDQLLKAETVNLMTSRHRVGQFDETLQHVVDFGLGIIIDSNHHGIDTVPYGFGRYCSDRTFGHGGSQCAMGFCDPDRQLVVCWAANGFCGEGQHQRRNRAINEAVYEDLGLT